MAPGLDCSKKSLVLVTGASRGIGRQIAVSVARRLNEGSIVVLLARSESGLSETSTMINDCNPLVVVKRYVSDLSQPKIIEYRKIMSEVATDVENAVVFHNAGSLGVLDKTTTLDDEHKWRSFFDLNVVSTSLLNTAFVGAMRGHAKNLFVVNISSLCGSQPFRSMGMYCVGKAARNMFFRVLAAEEPDVIVLNYSPGPVDTDMVCNVIDDIKNDEVKSFFVGIKREKTILDAATTVEKMVGILTSGEYTSGDIIDYYDRT